MSKKFLVTVAESTLPITVSDTANRDIVLQAIRTRFGLSQTTTLHVQYFDREWDSYVDVEMYEELLDKSKLRCIVKDFTQPNTNSVTVTSIDHIAPVQAVEILDESGKVIPTSEVHFNSDGSQVVVLAVPQQPTASSKDEVSCPHLGWPDPYIIPHHLMPSSVVEALEQKLDLKRPQFRYVRGLFVQTITHHALSIFPKPKLPQKTDIVKAIIHSYPHLRELSGNGYSAWYESLNNCIKQIRGKRKKVAETEVLMVGWETSGESLNEKENIPSAHVKPNKILERRESMLTTDGETSDESVNEKSDIDSMHVKPYEVPEIMESILTTGGETSDESLNEKTDIDSVHVKPDKVLQARESVLTVSGETSDGSSGSRTKSGQIVRIHSVLKRKAMSASQVPALVAEKSSPFDLNEPIYKLSTESVDLLESVISKNKSSTSMAIFQGANKKKSLSTNVVKTRHTVKRKPDVSADYESNYDKYSNISGPNFEMIKIMKMSDHERDPVKLRALLHETFTERQKLIHSKVSVTVIRKIYPALFTRDGLLADYSELSPENHEIMEAGQQRINKWALLILKYTEKQKVRGVVLGPKIVEILTNLDDARGDSWLSLTDEEIIKNDRRMICGLLLLAQHLNEDVHCFIKEYPPTTNIEQLKSAVMSPHLVVLGSPYQSDVFYIMVAGQPAVRLMNVFDGVLLLLVTYEVLSTEYPAKCRCTYIFLQEHILKQKIFQVPPKLARFVEAIVD